MRLQTFHRGVIASGCMRWRLILLYDCVRTMLEADLGGRIKLRSKGIRTVTQHMNSLP